MTCVDKMGHAMVDTRRIGNFELIERIGQGGMGAVFKARQISMDRIVALKILPPRLAKQPTFIERFLREAHACARLSHPNIVSGIDVGEDGGVYYFAMEYVEGSSAKRLIREGGLPEEQVLKIGRDIAGALAHAHRLGILHRDIKPDNILIDKDGTTKLCDLGLARLESQTEDEKSLTQDGTALGTPHYISPEQARGLRDLDAKTDLYSLGAMLYHLLTGKPMFDGDTSVVIMTKHLTGKCSNPADSGVRVGKGLVTILAKLLVKDRADRYESAEMLAEDLDRVAQGGLPQHAALPFAKWPFSGSPPGLQARKAGATGPATLSDKSRASQREPRAETAARSTKWLVLLGAAVAIAAVIAFSLSDNKPKPSETAAAPAPQTQAERATVPAASGVKPGMVVLSAEELKRLFDSAEDYEKNNPAHFTDAIAEFEKVHAAARGTAFEGKAKDAIADLNKRRDEAAESAAKKLSGEAGALAAQGKFDSAIAVWRKAAQAQAELLGPRSAKEITGLRGQAEAKLQAPLDDAEKCLTEKRWADGEKALNAAGDVEYSDWDLRIKNLRAKLSASKQAVADSAKNEALAKAENAFAQYVGKFVDATLKGDVKAARKATSDAKADSSLRDLAAKVQDMSDVSSAMEKAEAAKLAALEALKDGKEHSFETTKGTLKGKVLRVTAGEITVELREGAVAAAMPVRIADLKEAERKRLAGDFKPETATEHLALGIRALAAGDSAVATVELAAAKDHSLVQFYQTRLDETLLGAVEAAAKSAWEALERAAGTGKIPDQKAKELADKVAAFEREHGKTKFAVSIADKLAALQDRLFGQAQQLSLELGGGVKLELVLVSPGKFMMGSPAAKANRAGNDTQHQVTLTQPFYIGKYPVTQEQFELLMEKNPSTTKGAKNPVEFISWNDAQDFCTKASKKIDRTVKLPTEAEWEYACRAGSTTTYYFGDNEAALAEYCWFKDNSDDKPGEKKTFAGKMTHPVGGKKPNAWGLYDMHGSICQWCQDWFEKYAEQAVVDPQGPEQGKAHVLRGGSCNLPAGECQSAFRIGYPPERVSGHVGGFGFRVVMAKN